MMDCKKAQSLVTAYIKRELGEKETEEFIHHISHCRECHEELEIYFTIHFALQKLDEEENISYNIKKMLEDDLDDLAGDIVEGGNPPTGLQLEFFLINLEFHCVDLQI